MRVTGKSLMAGMGTGRCTVTDGGGHRILRMVGRVLGPKACRVTHRGRYSDR